MNNTLITWVDHLLASRLLGLSVLDFTIHKTHKKGIRKSSFTGLLGDFVLLLSSLLDIFKAHASNRSLNLVGLLASTLALLSSLKVIWKKWSLLQSSCCYVSRQQSIEYERASSFGSSKSRSSWRGNGRAKNHKCARLPTWPSLRMYIPPWPG